MEITGIRQEKGTRYRIEVDGEYWTILDSEIIAEFGFEPGKTVTPETLDEALKQADRRRARERAYYLLSYRDHSSGELMEKLAKNVDEEIALETVLRMKELGLVNDAEYARKLARSLMITKRYGAYRAKQEMLRKYLPNELIQDAIDSVSEEHESADSVRQLIERKYAEKIKTPEGRRKVVAALMRLGHRYGDIKEVLSGYPYPDGLQDDTDTDFNGAE